LVTDGAGDGRQDPEIKVDRRDLRAALWTRPRAPV